MGLGGSRIGSWESSSENSQSNSQSPEHVNSQSPEDAQYEDGSPGLGWSPHGCAVTNFGVKAVESENSAEMKLYKTYKLYSSGATLLREGRHEEYEHSCQTYNLIHSKEQINLMEFEQIPGVPRHDHISYHKSYLAKNWKYLYIRKRVYIYNHTTHRNGNYSSFRKIYDPRIVKDQGYIDSRNWSELFLGLKVGDQNKYLPPHVNEEIFRNLIPTKYLKENQKDRARPKRNSRTYQRSRRSRCKSRSKRR